ncbi:hypothetical protein [Variovorax boronicumulans]|uniref:hypothetical protein n=1 Tax=Variovorax boronicumulans TaxID=436515 RepID=UPI0012E5023B|nr:hypothetical protein [Variovorax boronicumulans]GER16707.1 hypothetical protein VCH24_17140 [Variovorax boronicumulans]
MSHPARDAARAVSLRHYLRLAELDVRYARYAAGELAKADPEWHDDVLDRLDADLIARGIPRPAPYLEPASKFPPLTKGRRGLPERKYFHDTL